MKSASGSYINSWNKTVKDVEFKIKQGGTYEVMNLAFKNNQHLQLMTYAERDRGIMSVPIMLRC